MQSCSVESNEMMHCLQIFGFF